MYTSEFYMIVIEKYMFTHVCYSLTTLLHSQMVRDGWIEELWLVGFIYPLKGKFLLSVHLEKSLVYVEINLEDALLHNISTF